MCAYLYPPDPNSVFVLAGCDKRGCEVLIKDEIGYSFDSTLEVFHTGKNPEAYKKFTRRDIITGPRVQSMKELVIQWIKAVHEYEDRKVTNDSSNK